MLTDESYIKNYYYKYEHVWTDEDKRQRLHNWEFQLSEKEPLWDAADAMRFGKDVFHQGSCVTKGVHGLAEAHILSLSLRLHHVLFDTPKEKDKPDNYHPWHIDVNFVPLRPVCACTIRLEPAQKEVGVVS
jgi:glycine amidinotransferase